MSENVKINYIRICLALLWFVIIGIISNKLNEYKTNNDKYLDIQNVIKIKTVNC
jgi:hypothetical protein